MSDKPPGLALDWLTVDEVRNLDPIECDTRHAEWFDTLSYGIARKCIKRVRREFEDNREIFYRRLAHVYGERCTNCGATEQLAIDHKIPVIRGGTNTWDNLQLLCKSCNSGKKDKLMHEWLRGVNG